MLNVNALEVAYGRAGESVVKNVNARFSANKFTALIGPNGCGKSTLLKCMMGFLPAKAGTVMIGETAISTMSKKQLASAISYLPQESYCPDYLTVGELVELGAYARSKRFQRASNEDRDRFRWALDKVGLATCASQSINTLSGGQKQRAWIAMILSQDSDIIMLDEPVNHLDIKHQYAVLNLVRELMEEQHKTVIAVLHDLNHASAFSDDVLLMCAGEVVAHGETRTVITAENIKTAFDFDAEILSQGDRVFCAPAPQVQVRAAQ